MTKKKKSIYPLWVLTPAILIYTLFSVVPIVIKSGMLFYRLEYGTAIHPCF